MTEKLECEIFLAMNEYREWRVSKDDVDVFDDLAGAVRLVKLTAKIAPPVMTEVTIDVPDEVDEPVEAQAEAA